MKKMNLVRRGPEVPNLRIGHTSQRDGLTWCGYCETTWTWVEPHTTMHNNSQGAFALCELCWQELGTNERRLPYYEEYHGERKEWPEIKAAVLRE